MAISNDFNSSILTFSIDVLGSLPQANFNEFGFSQGFHGFHFRSADEIFRYGGHLWKSHLIATALCRISLHCVAYRCNVSHIAALCRISLYYFAYCCIASHIAVLCRISLHCIAYRCIVSHFVEINRVAFRCITYKLTKIIHTVAFVHLSNFLS